MINCIKQNYNYKPYWLNTSDNALIKEQLSLGKHSIKAMFIAMLQGQTIQRPLKEEIIFPDLKASENTVWGLLHASGYLNVKIVQDVNYGEPVNISIPNKEVGFVYSDMIEHWFTNTLDLDVY